MKVNLYHGDSLNILRTLPENSIDSIITDPPAGISFMSRAWDSDKGGRDQWIAWLTEIMKECLRVLKPGGHALVWAIPRTSHWTGMALENAGWEVRDRISHLFASAMPKSLNISVALDKLAGEKPEIVGYDEDYARRNPNGKWGIGISGNDNEQIRSSTKPITEPVTEAGKKYKGFGTNLKPACEDWWLARKPISEDTIAENVLKHGTGGLNINASRIATNGEKITAGFAKSIKNNTLKLHEGYQRPWQEDHEYHAKVKADVLEVTNTLGRYPANVILSHSEACELVGTKEVKSSTGGYERKAQSMFVEKEHKQKNHGYGNKEGLETVERYKCSEDCPIFILDQQSGSTKSNFRKSKAHGKSSLFGNGNASETTSPDDAGGASRFFANMEPDPQTEEKNNYRYEPNYKNKVYGKGMGGLLTPENSYSDTGNVSRFFYCAKASKQEKTCNGTVMNTHCTVKPVSLMIYLIRLISPPNAVILDPFMGSGSTGVAAVRLGFDFVGIEQEESSLQTSHDRIHYESSKLGLLGSADITVHGEKEQGRKKRQRKDI